MARKTDADRLAELEKKIDQIKAKKQRFEGRMQAKERKDRTRRLIQVGAIFEKYFDIVGEDQAEKIAYGMKKIVSEQKENLLKIDIDKSKKENKIIYRIEEEKLILPIGEREYAISHKEV